MKTTRHLDVINNQPYVKSISLELNVDEARILVATLKNENDKLINNIFTDLTGQLSYCK